MKPLVVVAALLAVALAAPGPAPGPTPNADQESQASESLSKRGAARLSAVSGNSITDNTVSNAAPQTTPLQLQQQTPAHQQQQVPLYAPHPYSFVQPQPLFHYQPMPLLHSKYHAPGKPQVLQYVQPYFQVPQYQAPLMYIIPQPQPQAHQAHQAQQPQQTPQAGSQAGNQPSGQPEQPAPHQPQYVMVLSAPAPPLAPAAHGFQYFNHPQLSLPPQPLYSFYSGQQPQLQQPQLHQPQPYQPQIHQAPLHQPQYHQPQLHQSTRYFPEQQPFIYQSQQPEGPSPQNDGPPQFVQKQQNQQGPVGLEAPAPPTPASLVSSYGARVQSQPQHTYKTIIKA